jgi:DNA-binding transcriptional ArsR family regulator
MADEKFVLVSMDDERLKSLSDVLGNRTCKKIIEHLAENKEASEKDLSDSLGIAMNTIEYNMKKLLYSGFVQKRKNFFWSKKGKKIVMYELTNKSIIISPQNMAKDKVKSLFPAVITLAAGTFALWVYQRLSANETQNYIQGTPGVATNFALTAAPKAAGGSVGIVQSSPLWLWFLVGGLLVLGISSILNWRRL